MSDDGKRFVGQVGLPKRSAERTLTSILSCGGGVWSEIPALNYYTTDLAIAHAKAVH